MNKNQNVTSFAKNLLKTNNMEKYLHKISEIDFR